MSGALVGALLLDLAHQPAHVLAGVPGQLDDLSLPHSLPHRLSHGNGQSGSRVIGALLGCGLDAHCLPQRGNGLLGGGHVDMFAHQGGHTEVRHSHRFPTLARGHINVASWVMRSGSINCPTAPCPLAIHKDQHMAVSKRLRYEILRRDNHTCRYCGASAPDVPLRVDHVTPVALGGTDTPDNLVTSCEPCNSGKSSATVDSTVVANVADDALRWAAAMKQAADTLLEQEKPKLEYRAAFLNEWNRWGYGDGDERKHIELPGDWKPSIERFRVAGLPAWVWAEIVDTAMGYEKVLNSNKFKYCCGIAWNKVTQLQAEAKRIAGGGPASVNLDVRASVLEAAYVIWHCGMDDNAEAPTAEQEAEFRSSLANLSGMDLEAPERIIGAAQHATYFAMCDIAEALRDMDRDTVWTAWHAAWPTVYVPSEDPNEPWGGEVLGGPTDDQISWVKKQIDALLDAGVYVRRLVRAASHAGTHKSARLYLGLSQDELEKTGVHPWQSRASEIWSVAFRASDMREPTAGEREAFFASLQRIGKDGDFILADVYEAAAAAGSYKDPDLSTCLTRHLSAFEAAAKPLGGEN